MANPFYSSRLLDRYLKTTQSAFLHFLTKFIVPSWRIKSTTLWKKRLSFPSPAGMTLTKLSLAGNYYMSYDYGKGCRTGPLAYVAWRAGTVRQPLPQSILSPQSGTMNWASVVPLAKTIQTDTQDNLWWEKFNEENWKLCWSLSSMVSTEVEKRWGRMCF